MNAVHAMDYRSALQTIDALTVLKALELETEIMGGYIKFPCLECDGKAVIKMYGKKKNSYFCTKCRKAGTILSLAQIIRSYDKELAQKYLSKLSPTPKKITEELKLNYELTYHDYLKERCIAEENAQWLGIGVPNDKSMMSDCILFTVQDEIGMKAAYFGINMKTGEPVYDKKAFNPELYLYGYYTAKHVKCSDVVFFTDDMFECASLWCSGNNAVCNFGLPYISEQQLDLLGEFESLIIWDEATETIHRQLRLICAWLLFV